MVEVNLTILQKYFEEGLIKRQVHPELELYIWNYAEKIQFNREWDAITKMCRGLVTDFEYNIVARSFTKFFNLEEVGLGYVNLKSNVYKDHFKVYEKLDGSMGMLFYYEKGERWVFCSRGSFTSKQAVRGRQILDERIDYNLLDKHLTYVFEIIYPDNRIVVNYNFEDTIFITAFEKDGKEVIGYNWQNKSVVKEYLFKNPELLKKENIEGREGYVLRFNNGERVKIKFENYLKLHKQVSNLTVQNAFDWYKNGEDIEKVLKLIPDEYHNWYKEIIRKVESKYDKIKSECEIIFKSQNILKLSKKEFANKIKNSRYKAILFKLYDKYDKYENENFDSEKFTDIFTSCHENIYRVIEYSEFFTELKKEDLSMGLRDSYANSRHQNVLNTYKNSDEKFITEYPFKENSCYIFDIDGTLALNLNGRSPYDMSRVLEDAPNRAVIEALKITSKEYKIIICTGRNEDAEENTKCWLKRYNIEYTEIYFRPYKNREPDYLIKERMWRHINEKYNIIALYDDRNQVVNHGRKLGLNVFQVAEGDF